MWKRWVSHARCYVATEDWKIRILIKWYTLTTGGPGDIWQDILLMGNPTHEDDLVQALFSDKVSKSKWGQIPLQTWQIILSSESVKCTKTSQLPKQQDGRTSHMLHPVQIPRIFRFAFSTWPQMTPSSYVAFVMSEPHSCRSRAHRGGRGSCKITACATVAQH